MRGITIYLILMIFVLPIFSQNAKTDSLKNLLKNHEKQDTVRVKLLNELAYILRITDWEKSLEYASKADSLSKSLDYKKGESLSLRIMGIYYYNKADYSNASDCYNKALELAKEIDDKAMISSNLNNISLIHSSLGEYEKALDYSERALQIRKKIGDKSKISESLNNTGDVYFYRGNYPVALEYYRKALKINEEIGNKPGMATSFNGIGIVYYFKEDYEKSISYFQKYVDIEKKTGNEKAVATGLSNIGHASFEMGAYQKAVDYFRKSITINKKLGDKHGLSSSLNGMGKTYFLQDNYTKAVDYFKKSLNTAEEINADNVITDNCVDLSKTYYKLKKYELALQYGEKGYKLAKQNGAKEMIKDAADILSQVYSELGNYKKAYNYHVEYKVQSDSLQNEKNTEKIVGLEYQYKFEKEKELAQARQKRKEMIQQEELKRQKLLRNSFVIAFILMIIIALYIFRSLAQKRKANRLLEKQNIEIETKNEMLQQQKEEILTQSEELEKINSELEKLSIVASETDNAVVIMDKNGKFEWINAGFTKLYGYSFKEFSSKYENIFAFSSNKKIAETIDACIAERKPKIYETVSTAKDGADVWVQTTLTPILDHSGNIKKIIAIDSDIRKLKEAEKLLKFKNQQITASIRYAKTIQTAMLPFKDYINQYFDNFILFRPKDIVSGDFYWYVQTKDYHFFAAVDCTGHGVPGAFMSMIGSSVLNQIVYNENEYNTAKILTRLDKLIVFSLRQEKTDNNDGMDVSLCRIEKNEQNEMRRIQYTGAKRPLMYVNAGETQAKRLRGDRKSIGGTQRKRNETKFSVQELQLKKGTMLYLSSDGFADQNNSERQKFGSSKILDLLQTIAGQKLSEQKRILENTLDKHMQGTKQRDDITLLGIKI